MMKSTIAFAVACLAFSVAPAIAGTSVKANIVPTQAATNPLLSNKSSFKIDGKGNYQISVKGMTDNLGNLVPVSNGTTPDTQHWVTIHGGVPGLAFQYNAPFNPSKPGEAKIKGSLAGLVALLPAGTSIGIQSVEVHQPTLAGQDTSDCTDVMTIPLIADPVILQIYIEGVSPYLSNPCASGALVGLSGISTVPPAP
jgi:hypothetical protein